MKKQTKTYLLLVAVLLIWGIIGYKIVGAISPKPVQEEVEIKTVDFTPEPLVQKDTFSLIANYRDPFLGTLATKPKKKSTAKKAIPKNPVPEVTIEYTGLITDNETKEKIFFIRIAGQQYLMSARDKIEGFTLISGSESQVRIRDGKKTRTIPLKT